MNLRAIAIKLSRLTDSELLELSKLSKHASTDCERITSLLADNELSERLWTAKHNPLPTAKDSA